MFLENGHTKKSKLPFTEGSLPKILQQGSDWCKFKAIMPERIELKKMSLNQ